LLTMDAVVLNCVTQFNIVWRVGKVSVPPDVKMSSKNPLCYSSGIVDLKKKTVPAANARCSSDQRCIMTESFKPLYPAMCVSPRHLQRCRHGAKFKSSICFCPILYILLSTIVLKICTVGECKLPLIFTGSRL